MNLEEQTLKINSLIRENGHEINVGGEPDMAILEKEIASFLDVVKKLDAEKAKEYLNLVNIWMTEMKKISDSLNQAKDKIRSEIGQAQAQSRANNAYSATKKTT